MGPMAEAAAAVRPALWLVDTPRSTSHDVVLGIRRRLGRGTKVGHTGTLDPFATGLLVVLVGRATRLAAYLTAPRQDLPRHGPHGIHVRDGGP